MRSVSVSAAEEMNPALRIAADCPKDDILGNQKSSPVPHGDRFRFWRARQREQRWLREEDSGSVIDFDGLLRHVCETQPSSREHREDEDIEKKITTRVPGNDGPDDISR